MPTYYLKIKADLENIEKLSPISDNLWKFDIESDGGDTRKGITVSTGDAQSLDGSRGEAHFIIKWPGAHSQSYIQLVPVKKVTGNYEAQHSGKWTTILGLECRGLVPTNWIPGVDFNSESSGGTRFEEIDLSEKEWVEYDERNDLSVSVMNLEYKIETSA